MSSGGKTRLGGCRAGSWLVEMNLGVLEEDVPFDHHVANALISAFDTAASRVEGQIGSRSSLVTSALVEFRKRFTELFESNAGVAARNAE